MTQRDLADLAQYHGKQAEQLFTAAKVLSEGSATDARSRAAQHLQWSKGLEDLRTAFATFAEVSKAS